MSEVPILFSGDLKACGTALQHRSLLLITTEPAFTEAMYLIYQIGRWLLHSLLNPYEEVDAYETPA